MGRVIFILLIAVAVIPIQGGDCQLLSSLFQAVSDLLNIFSPPTTTTTTRPTTTTATTSTTRTTTTTKPTTATTTTPNTATTTSTARASTTTPTPTTTRTTTAAVASGCGQGTKTVSERIVGGTNSTPGMWPWQAALLVRYRGGINDLFCGGSLISTRHVVTAAHCTNGRSTSNTFVRLNEVDFNNPSETVPYDYTLTAIRQHPQYNSNTQENDITILLLNGVAPVGTPYVGVICLPPANANFTNQTAYVSGWGTTSEGGNVSPILQDVAVPVISNADCNVVYSSSISDSMICAGGVQGKDSCQGDSGGPLEVKVGTSWQLAGIVSFGYGCAQAGVPGVYTRVSSFLTWIRQNTPEVVL